MVKVTRHKKTENDYRKLIEKELSFYVPLAAELDIAMEVVREAARLGLRNGLLRHRESHCKQRESGCVAGSIRHFCDRIIVKTCLMAVNEYEMERAEDILMRLIEES
jgi:hypothetical protein